MIIKSNFKDYYDFVPHQYGGGDPGIVYNRIRLNPFKTAQNLDFDRGIELKSKDYREIQSLPSLPYNTHPFKNNQSYKWLVITGRLYLLVSKSSGYNPEYELFCEAKHTTIAEGKPSHDDFELGYGIYDDGKSKKLPMASRYLGVQLKSLVELSKFLDAPVFCIRSVGWRDITIDCNVPILTNTGIPSIIEPNKIYQEISYFIANTMHTNPDIEPPVRIGEKDRIVSHGFDLKQSFRHRKSSAA